MHAKLLNFTNQPVYVRLHVQINAKAAVWPAARAHRMPNNFRQRKISTAMACPVNKTYGAAGVAQQPLSNHKAAPKALNEFKAFALFYCVMTAYAINHWQNSSSNKLSLRQLLQPLPVVQMLLCAGKMCPEQWACAHTLACGTATDRHSLALHLLRKPLQLALCSCSRLSDAACASSGTDGPGCML